MCAAGYYANTDGACAACPPKPKSVFVTILLPIVTSLGYGIAVFAGVTAATYALGRGRERSRLKESGLLAGGFLSWGLISLQPLILVARMAPPGTPAEMQSLFAALKIMHLQLPGAVPGACLGSSASMFLP